MGIALSVRVTGSVYARRLLHFSKSPSEVHGGRLVRQGEFDQPAH
jgi:hypothetical protein